MDDRSFAFAVLPFFRLEISKKKRVGISQAEV